jgi:GT2 family glycosyltransferase
MTLRSAPIKQTRELKLVSIIIPSLHRPDLSRKCLESLVKQQLPADQWEAVVVENDARPDAILQDPLPWNARRLLLNANYGTAGATNRGLAASLSKYVLLLNNDVELEPDFLEVLVSILERSVRCAFAVGKLLNANNNAKLDGAGDALLMGGGAYRLGHGDADVDQFAKESSVLGGCGAAALFRRSVLEEIEGLDEDFFAYLDDMDLALRCYQLGYKGLYVPSAVAYHIGSATLGERLHPKILELLTRNQLSLVVKNYPLSILVRLIPRILVFQILWFSLAVRKGSLLPYVQGIGGAIRLFPTMLRKRREILARTRISGAEFLALLRASEGQIYAWHNARPRALRPRLLSTYFALFGAPY